jgi:hypothetical protein
MKKSKPDDDSWPEEFFKLIGSIDDESFEVPEELPWSLDAKRLEFD